jgi:hypothetical protein
MVAFDATRLQAITSLSLFQYVTLSACVVDHRHIFQEEKWKSICCLQIKQYGNVCNGNSEFDFGKYWHFTAASNDFLVVSNGAIQYHLKFNDDGFYYFEDMSYCASALVILGNSTLPPVLDSLSKEYLLSKIDSTPTITKFSTNK